MKPNYDEMSIKDMCQPLSAKVLPASAYYPMSGGNKMSEEQALQAQARVLTSSLARKRKSSV